MLHYGPCWANLPARTADNAVISYEISHCFLLTTTYGHLKFNIVISSDWVTPDCAARAVRAMDVTMPPETHSEHIARSKQAGVTQSDIKFKCPFVLHYFAT
jgi:hypothetical protein